MNSGTRPSNDDSVTRDLAEDKAEKAERKILEDQLDVSEEDSFPASDPPSMTDPTKGVKKPE